MSRLSVKEYATLNNISVQSVYKKIKSGILEAHTINNTKYIIIEDKIDYEKKFNDLQLKYEALQKEMEVQKEIISILKEDRKLFTHLIEYKKEVKQLTTNDKKKSNKEKDKKKKKKK